MTYMHDDYLMVDQETFEIACNNCVWYFNDCFNTLEKEYKRKQYIAKHLQKELPAIKIIPTNRCQLNCNYCYTFRDRIKNTIDLSFESIEPILRDFFYKNKDCVISFVGGGEPTCNFELIEKCVEYVKKNAVAAKYSIISNGLFSEQVGRFFVDNNFHVVISLDGNYELMRNQQCGKYTIEQYNQALINFTQLSTQKVSTIINAVISLEQMLGNAHVLVDTCKHFQTHGVSKINIGVDNSIWCRMLSDDDISMLVQGHIYLLEWIAEQQTIRVNCEILKGRINYLEYAKCSSVYGGKGFSILPSGAISYCYNDQFLSINTCENISNTIYDSVEQLRIAIDKYKVLHCDTCIARQICFVNRCPVNFKAYILEACKGVFCNNLIKFRLGILKYYINRQSVDTKG